MSACFSTRIERETRSENSDVSEQVSKEDHLRSCALSARSVNWVLFLFQGHRIRRFPDSLLISRIDSISFREESSTDILSEADFESILQFYPILFSRGSVLDA